MLCLSQIDSTNFQVASPQPTEYTSCLYVLAQPQDLTFNAWALDVTQGSQIALAIAVCWAIGWAFRAAISLLKPNESENQND